MTQLDDGHDYLHAKNKDKIFQKKKNDLIPLKTFLDEARKEIKHLLQNVSSDELINIINEERIFSVSITKKKKENSVK